MAVSKAMIGLMCALLFIATSVAFLFALFSFSPIFGLLRQIGAVAWLCLGIAAIFFSIKGFKESRKVAIAAMALTAMPLLLIIFFIIFAFLVHSESSIVIIAKDLVSGRNYPTHYG